MNKPTKKPVVKMPDGSQYRMTNAEVLQFFDTVLAKDRDELMKVLADDAKYQQQAKHLTKSQRQGIASFIKAVNKPYDDEAIDTSIDEICGVESQPHVTDSKRKSH
jgi:ketosteroid isomerase-like protein